jgi:hypothetical protein
MLQNCARGNTNASVARLGLRLGASSAAPRWCRGGARRSADTAALPRLRPGGVGTAPWGARLFRRVRRQRQRG